jgi:hypothetical protein
MAFLNSKRSLIMQKNWIMTLVFNGKGQFFSPKIAEIIDHSIDPFNL